MHHTSQPRHRKAKKSYTLSAESVEFLEALRTKRRVNSVSAVLEEILQAARREENKAVLERSVSDFYDSFSAKEASKQAIWGEFAVREFPSENN